VICAVIPLGKDEVDLAVRPIGKNRVIQRFTTYNDTRLLSGDKLFAPDGIRSYAQRAHAALVDMRQRYKRETENCSLIWDQSLADWFVMSFEHFDKLIMHYQKQC
jgi:hypothetical protein